MAETLARQIRRLRNQLATQRGESESKLAELAQGIAVEHERYIAARGEVRALEEELNRERVTRVSAQRGLVAYMKEHDLGHRIGYDPDKDQAVLAEIEAGRIPPALS